MTRSDKNRLKTIIDLEKLNRFNDEGCPACKRKFTLGEPVVLACGAWEGEPYVEGGASRPRVGLIEDLWLLGDVNGDGKPEAVTALWHSSGGSGTRNYVAVLERRAAGSVNTATALLGDRVRIDGGAIENGIIRLDLVEHGPDEPACCPTHAVSRYYDGDLNLIETKKRNTE